MTQSNTTFFLWVWFSSFWVRPLSRNEGELYSKVIRQRWPPLPLSRVFPRRLIIMLIRRTYIQKERCWLYHTYINEPIPSTRLFVRCRFLSQYRFSTDVDFMSLVDLRLISVFSEQHITRSGIFQSSTQQQLPVLCCLQQKFCYYYFSCPTSSCAAHFCTADPIFERREKYLPKVRCKI